MRKIKVHIADDHKILIDGISAVLNSQEDIEIVGYSLDGSQTVKWFEENDADVLVLDINMPNLNGIDVMQAFQKKKSMPNIVILSSYDEMKLIKEVLKIGAKGFLTKKCAGENIVEAIKSVDQGKQYFSESIQKKMVDYLSGAGEESNNPESTFFSPLTEREKEVLKLIGHEMSTKEIAEKLFISVNTVETHRKKLMKKLGVKNVVGLVIYAMKHKII
ncbi:response regulator [Aureivirga sp. CE67]|uniref:response regulator n=1 Tax=Aureivirga sp. CE67 TaxID=1788983 RepID=UPI0018C9A766|nr:response regulator transcription factor [Aureivirga sp. CE67]